MTAEQARDKAATLALQVLTEEVDSNYCPSQELILAARAFNGAVARLCSRHGLAVTPEGRIFSAGAPQPPRSAG